MSTLWPYIAGLAPTVVVAAFFYVLVKRIIESDRNERLAQRRFEEEEDRRLRDSGKSADADVAKRPENDGD